MNFLIIAKVGWETKLVKLLGIESRMGFYLNCYVLLLACLHSACNGENNKTTNSDRTGNETVTVTGNETVTVVKTGLGMRQ